jgi:hypothetical protein
MDLQSLGNFLARFLSRTERNNHPSTSTTELSEQTRLLHRLNCLKLDEEEAKCLQGYLTTILQARYQNQTSDKESTPQSDCLVLEMSDEEFQELVCHVGGNGTRLFRAIVKSDNSDTYVRKITIVGEQGLRLFNVLIQGRNSLPTTR